MIVIVIVATRSVRVSVAAEDKEADEVGEEAGASNDEDKLGLRDLGGFDETSQGFENDGHAEGDEKYGVEEGTEDFSANKLSLLVSSSMALSREHLHQR